MLHRTQAKVGQVTHAVDNKVGQAAHAVESKVDHGANRQFLNIVGRNATVTDPKLTDIGEFCESEPDSTIKTLHQ